MNIWKEIAKHGRHGDTMMKKIDGDFAHVNAVEYEMSPEYIKEHGSGTINPITGKKEFNPLAMIQAGLSIGSALYGGFSALGAGKDVEAGKTAAGDIYREKLELLQQRSGAARKLAQSQYTTGMEELTLGTQMGARDIKTGVDVATAQSGLATSGTIQGKMQTQMKDLMAQYKTTAQKQMDMKSYDLAQADFAYRSGEMSAEEAYQDTLTALEQEETTFLGGMFS